MVYSATATNTKLLALLRRLAPPSIIDRGVECSQNNKITETSKSGNKVIGLIRDDDGSEHNIQLEILSSQDVLANCTCCTLEDIAEQWCYHAVALLWKASDLGFFESHSGFASSESTIRMNTSTPQEIAGIIKEVSQIEGAILSPPTFSPEVSILLDFRSDRLGVRLLFDDELQGPAVFEEMAPTSRRALDNLLLQMLEDEGSWDEHEKLWYVNASSSIEKILGLIQEYDKVSLTQGTKRIAFESELLSAQLLISWLDSGAELELRWVLPNGKIKEKTGELLGTGPYWTCLDNSVFRLSSSAARIASIFTHASRINLTRSQVGPVLEAISNDLYDSKHIVIQNQELQPKTKIVSPTPLLEFHAKDLIQEHFDSSQTVQISTSLDFKYPSPPRDKNIVYLPNREEERQCIDLLRSLSFSLSSDKRRYLINGDAALDLLQTGQKAFPTNWKVEGLDNIRSSVRFADLSINLSISERSGDAPKKASGAIDWFDCHVSLIRNNANVPLSTIFKNSRGDNDRWVCLDNGSFARVPGGSLSYLKTALGILDPNYRLSNSIKTKLNMAQAISLSRIDDNGFNLSLSNEVKTLSDKFKSFKNVSMIKTSKNFEGKLRSYQEEGLSWLNFLTEFELGGILADEMGLGKTVQALALFQYLRDNKAKRERFNKPALIVAPTSVITNWLYEARRFTPGLKVLLLHGPSRKAHFSDIPNYDLVITSYALLRIDRYDLEKHEFSFCVLDEAQNIKNSQAATTKAAKSIRARARLALSGTPTENRPMELWSIMDFLMPGYLGSVDFFRNHIEKPILEGGPGTQVIKFLNAKTKPFLLRRTKAEVERDLPPKIESLVHVEMTPSQQQLYAQILNEVRPRVFDAINKKGVRGASVSILAALLRLRQVCNHPNSIESLKELPGFDSGKFNLLKDLVEEALQSNRKILLFSQFKEMLAIIRRWLTENGTPHLYLDGATRDRQSLIDRFNNDSEVRLFLISLKAGGTGLNLTAADTVIIYDPWWNPAVESQAVDRAHRIGQSKTVSVYRLVTENSIEQKIMDLKTKKSKIVDALVNENGLSTVKLTQSDLESLFEPFPEQS